MTVKDFPELSAFKGHTLITTDGTTLLGADDKAGVAEIMTAAEYLMAHPEIKHGKIRIGFTPDEEVGRGVDYFNVEKFGAKFFPKAKPWEVKCDIAFPCAIQNELNEEDAKEIGC